MKILLLLNDQIIINPDELKITEQEEEFAIFKENEYQRQCKNKIFFIRIK